MFRQNRWVALSLLVAIVASTLMISAPAQAKSSTWKKVAIGAGVVAGYGLLKHKKGLAIGAGAVALGSYLKYRHDRKRERSGRYRTSRYRSTRYRNTRYRSYAR